MPPWYFPWYSHPRWSARFASAQQMLSLHRKKMLALAGVGLMLFSAAGAIASFGERSHSPAEVSGQEISIDLPLAVNTPAESADAAPTAPKFLEQYRFEDRARNGDTLGAMLLRVGATDAAALRFIRDNPLASQLLKLRPGTEFNGKIDEQGRLLALHFAAPDKNKVDKTVASWEPRSNVTRRVIHIERYGSEFRATQTAQPLERRVEMRSGTVKSSLYAATDDAGVPDEVVKNLAEIFESKLDFYLHIRKGDAFRVVYEALYSEGRYVQAGRVLAAEIVNKNKPYQAVWFETSPGKGGYYTLAGNSLKASFLRTPLAFSRVSSGFTDARFHPIHQRLQAHTGVDYAAPTGTPVRSVADGAVEFSGWQNGYGNVVFIKHNGVYSTVYAHLSKIAPGMRKGSKVQQGQFIGAVGSTGWATGPHLHYEVRIKNQPQNPLTVALPNSPAIDKRLKPAFQTHIAQVQRQLELLSVAPVALR